MFFVAQGCSSLPLKAVYKYRSGLFASTAHGCLLSTAQGCLLSAAHGCLQVPLMAVY
jgi:hypothetical protein